MRSIQWSAWLCRWSPLTLLTTIQVQLTNPLAQMAQDPPCLAHPLGCCGEWGRGWLLMESCGFPPPPPSPPTPQAPIFFQALAFLIFMHLSKHRQGTPHHDKYDKSSFESSFHSPPPPERHSLRNHGSMAHTSNVCLVFMGTAF